MPEEKLASDWTHLNGDQQVNKIIIVYVGVGNLSPDGVDEAIDSCRERYKSLFALLPTNVGVMFLPTRTGDSNIEYLLLTPEAVKE